MISVLMEAGEDEAEKLARTLASLVSASVEGAVREAVVIAPADAATVALVADHAGCGVSGSLRDAVASARAGWLLFLEPGARLLEGWTEVALAHAAEGGRPARFSPDGSVGMLRRWRLRRRALEYGLLIARRDLPEGGPGRMRTVRLPARIAPAG